MTQLCASMGTKQALVLAPPYHPSPPKEEPSILKPHALHNLEQNLSNTLTTVEDL